MAGPRPSIERVPRPSRRAFGVAFAASLALHFALVSELPGISLRVEPAATELSAELVTRPPPPVAVAEAAAASKLEAKPAPAPGKVSVPSAVPAPAVVDAPSETIVPAATDWAESEPLDPVGEAAPQVAEAAAAQPEPVEPAPAAAAPVAAAPAAPAQPQPPQTGSIRYEVYLGSDRFSIGRSVQTWSIDKDSYRLTSFSETTGLAGLFKPYQFAYTAEGRVGPGRLRPDSFTVRRGREGERQASAHFDWESGELTFGSARSTRKAALNADSYDFLTLFYQLALTALAPGRMQVSVTTGTKFNTYLLEIGAQEMLELPIGTVRAIPVKQVRKPGEESIEFWLAPEKRYLPVRIRFLNDEGKLSVEQLATQIELGTVAADAR